MFTSRQRSLGCMLVLLGVVSACRLKGGSHVNGTGSGGRALSLPRFLERIDRNRLRVVAFAFGGVSVGQCADASGALRPRRCIETDATPAMEQGESLSKLAVELQEQRARAKAAQAKGPQAPEAQAKEADLEKAQAKEIEEWVHSRYGVRPRAEEIASLLQTSAGELPEASKRLVNNAFFRALSVSSGELQGLSAADLNTGVFSQYTRTLDIDLTGSLDAGANEAKSSNAFKRYEIIYEWRRYALIKIPGAPAYKASEPHVTSIEGGFAVRMVISVTTLDTKQEGKGSGAVGLADLEMGLALGRSEVYVSYELTGANHAMLPEAPLTIRNTQQLWEAFEKFHAAMRRLEDSWTCAMQPKDKQQACCGSDTGSKASVSCPMENRFDVLAYYVQGDEVGDIYAEFESSRERCYNVALAQSSARKKVREAAQKKLKACLEEVTETYEESIGGQACYRQVLAQVQRAKDETQRTAAKEKLWMCVEKNSQAQEVTAASRAGGQSQTPAASGTQAGNPPSASN